MGCPSLLYRFYIFIYHYTRNELKAASGNTDQVNDDGQASDDGDQNEYQRKRNFKRGTSVDIHDLNKYNGRYIVDYCQLIRNDITYLPVHFREYHDQSFSSALDPQHYSFILAVSTELCKSPLLPHLQPHITNHGTITIRPRIP